LAYISPEQTGRMNRVIDYRSDFYSLGVTFYELLTGYLPFATTDPMELVHAHIAQYPGPAHERRPHLPRPLSDIVAKLMAKNAEDRYQSAQGLKVDLERCLQEWQASRQVVSFPLGQHDISDQFQISQKLYGREQEIEILLAAFERVAGTNAGQEVILSEENQDAEKYQSKIVNRLPWAVQGKSQIEMMLVSGYAGIGKSALVQELYRSITHRRGYYTTGKFDQFQRNIPYSALIQAFRFLMRQLLTESEADIANWRKALLEALGPNGQVIIEVIPEVELITGPQPAVPELGPAEAQNRFNLVFQNFIRVCTRPEHPLVVFLDDLQWADGASLKLLELLMTTPESQYLFLIGAYRDNEVGEAHPLRLTLADIQKAGATLNDIALSPLALPHVSQLLADTLKTGPEHIKALAELVQAKTGGNPFFINEFLKSLYAEALLTFNHRQGVWQWSLAEIQQRDITDNVVELMAAKINHLAAETQASLRLAACIGAQFELETLAVVSRQPSQAAAKDLWLAIAEGLVVPLSENYKLLETDIDLTHLVSFKFAHDRVQQAVYSLIAEQDKQATHYQIGQLLLNATAASPEEREQKIFAIVNQLNFGTALIQEQARRDELAALNLLAGRKAKASAAYEPAYNYLQVGIGLSGESGWQRAYEVTLALYVEAAEAAYLSGRFEEMERLTGAVLAQAQNPVDKAKAYEVQVRGYIAQNNPPAAIKTTLQALNLLGVTIPEQPGEADIGQSLMKTQAAWSQLGIDKLVDLPRMSALDKLAAIQIISTVMPVTYVAAPLLVPILACAMVDLSIEHGNAPASTFGYATYGLVLCGALGDLEAGYQFGQLALGLLDRLNAVEHKARTYFYVYLFTTHWKEHLRASLAPAQEAYRSGLESGDIGNSALTAMLYCYHAYLAGAELTGLIQEMAQYSQAMRQFKQDFVLLYNELYRYAALSWIQPGEREKREERREFAHSPFAHSPFFEDYYAEMLKVSEQTQNRSAIWVIYLNRLMYNTVFQRYGEALENAESAAAYIDAATAAITPPVYYLYDSLTRLALYPEAPEAEKVGQDNILSKEALLKKVAANQEILENWSQHAPMNFLHKFYLVEAERARVLDQSGQARDYYDKAIDLAQEHSYLNEEALAGELAARFYLALGQTRLARHYLQDARYAYQRWGASLKVKDLEARYPQLLAASLGWPGLMRSGARFASDAERVAAASGATATAPSDKITSRPSLATTTGSTTASSTLDLTSVLRASQTISGEIVLQTLLAKLMKLLLENAGAERGFLILLQEETSPHTLMRSGVSPDAETPPHSITRSGASSDSRSKRNLQAQKLRGSRSEASSDAEAGRAGAVPHLQWVIEAEGLVGQADREAQVTALQAVPIAGSDRLSTAIINYVARTREAVVLNDATQEGRFSQDQYITTHRPKSLLCTPLVNQGNLIGLLYLENNLTSGAFTPDRLQVLNLLSTQAAISIENASLYANLERSERKYRTLFEDSKDTIFITTPSGQIIDINPAGLELSGYSRQEMAQINIQDIYADPADRLKFREIIERDGVVRDFEVRYRRKDGTELICLETASVRYAEDGSVLSYEGIIRDITTHKQAEQERLTLTTIQRELSIAQEIQHSLLPPPKPAWSGLDVSCYSMPAREVGGDLYAYHAFSPNAEVTRMRTAKRDESGEKYAVAIGDVSGKGIPAALLMAVSLASFQTAVGQDLGPSSLLSQLDQTIELYTGASRQNCALVYVEISRPAATDLPRPQTELGNEEETGAERLSLVRVANAGCIPPLIRRVDGSVEWAEVGGMPLGTGLGRGLGYGQISLTLQPGELIVLSSDGVVEAQNNQGDLFGFERLEGVVARGEAGSSAAMLSYLLAEVAAFVEGAEPNDDLTMVVVQV
jgi:PAS domain S-box-containing protein